MRGGTAVFDRRLIFRSGTRSTTQRGALFAPRTTHRGCAGHPVHSSGRRHRPSVCRACDVRCHRHFSARKRIRGVGGRSVDKPRVCRSRRRNTVAVLDPSGTVISTLTGEAGADGLLVRNGSLYVANANAGTIDEFDTTTLHKTRTVATGLLQPRDLVYAAGALWTQSGSALAQVDVTTGGVTTWPTVSLGGLVSDPANAQEIVTYMIGSSPVSMELSSTSRRELRPGPSPNRKRRRSPPGFPM